MISFFKRILIAFVLACVIGLNAAARVPKISPWLASASISFFGESHSADSATITMPPSIQAGDIGIILDFTINTSGSSPTSVTPSGFNAIGTSQSDNAGPNYWRWNMSYKVLDGSETTITGMAAEACSLKQIVVFRKTSGTWSAPSSVNTAANYPSVAPQTVTVGAAPLFVLASVGVGSALTMNPIYDANYTNSCFLGYYSDTGYLIYANSPSNNNVYGGTPGGIIFLGSFYVSLSP